MVGLTLQRYHDGCGVEDPKPESLLIIGQWRWCWTPRGALVYREAGYVDSWGNACPVINIHLGLHAKHYVLLRAAPSEVVSHEGIPGDCRAGGPRSRTRERIFPRSQVASRQLRLRSRARQVLRTAAGLPPLATEKEAKTRRSRRSWR